MTISPPRGGIAADEAIATLDPNISDEAIASTVADYLMAQVPSSRVHHLPVMLDVRPSALRRLERLRRKFNPNYRLSELVGPCSLACDCSRKNIVGISTRDRDRTRRWIIEAMPAAYGMFRGFSRRGSGYGRGSIAAIRALQVAS